MIIRAVKDLNRIANSLFCIFLFFSLLSLTVYLCMVALSGLSLHHLSNFIK